ncbi:hypothetical protein Tco_0104965, partial [Tanacetum coccineum]
MVATLRVVIHAGDKTSGDASSWYMISGDAKCVVSKVVLLSVFHAALVILHDALRALVGTRTDSSYSSSSLDSTTPLSPDHPLTHVSPTPTPNRALFHRKTTRMTVRVQPAMSL